MGKIWSSPNHYIWEVKITTHAYHSYQLFTNQYYIWKYYHWINNHNDGNHKRKKIYDTNIISNPILKFYFSVILTPKLSPNFWVPTIPARLVRSLALVLHLNMRVNNLINHEWDVGLLEDYDVSPEDIPFIKSLAISSVHRRDTFCWNYTKNGQYTV